MDVTTRTNRNEIIATPTLDTSAYAAGDLLCAKIVLNNPRGWSDLDMTKIVLADKAKQSIALDLVFFQSNPTSLDGATVNDPFDPSDADLLKITGVAQVDEQHWLDFNDNSAAVVAGKIPLHCSAGVLYVALVARGTATYAASDMQLRFELERR